MSTDLGLLILRVVVGVLFIGHGTQKLFGWFGGHGLAGTAGWLGSMGLRPPRFWAVVAGVAEAGGGLLLALGLLNPLGSLGIIASMVMAVVKVHWPKVWVTESGFEYPLVNIAVAVALALTGPGRYALDTALGIALPMPQTFILGLAVVFVGLLTALATATTAPTARRRPRAAA